MGSRPRIVFSRCFASVGSVSVQSPLCVGAVNETGTSIARAQNHRPVSIAFRRPPWDVSALPSNNDMLLAENIGSA